MRVLRLAGFLLMMWGLEVAGAKQTPVTPGPGTQATATTSPSPLNLPLPKDPVNRLELACKVNGLEAADIQPWHLKATFEIQDPDGKPLDKGTFEEWWAGPKGYKVIYNSQSFSQTEYGTEKGAFREGNTQIPPYMLATLRDTIGRPVRSLSKGDLRKFELQDLERQVGSLQLQCVEIAWKKSEQQSTLYCFEPPKAVLRYLGSSWDNEQMVFNNESVFNGRYIAKEFVLLILGRPILSADIDVLEPVQSSDPAFAAVPADAVLVNEVVAGSGDVFKDPQIVSRVSPQYPIDAKTMGIKGTVMVTGTVTTDGHVTDVQAWSGPSRLRAAAVNAVSQWRYTPALAGGKPVDFQLIAILPFVP